MHPATFAYPSWHVEVMTMGEMAWMQHKLIIRKLERATQRQEKSHLEGWAELSG